MFTSVVFCTVATLILSVSNASNESGPTVSLSNPKGCLVEGHILKTDLGNDIYAYQDIPYAEPPVGHRRFQKSVLSKGWQGTVKAKQTKRVCLQSSAPHGMVLGRNYTEDCLVLSVYSPTKPYSTKKYPVLVWIHGGAFQAGAGNLYHPKHFIDEDIVMVTINYRLGPMGFLTTGDEVIPANLGLHDQLLAIRWVHENIEVFGGDAKNMVIAGESAGGSSVSYHLLGSEPSKYYTGAIIQSGSSACPSAYVADTITAAVRFAQTLNPEFKAGNSSSILKLLQQASEEELYRTLKAITDYKYLPTVGTGQDFAEYQTEAFDNGRTKRIPLLVGFNSEESIYWYQTRKAARTGAMEADATGSIGGYYNIKEENRKAAFESLRRFYTKGNFSGDLPAFVRYSSDTRYIRSVVRTVQSYSKYVPDTYLYQLAYKPSTYHKCDVPGVDGVGHAADLQLLFNTQRVVSVNSTKADILMSKRIVRIWANFIKYRNPTLHPEPLLENIRWPKVTPNHTAYLNLTTSLNFGTNPRRCDQWVNVWDKYLQHPISIY